MRTLRLKILLAFVIFGFGFTRAQYVTIPDSVFNAWMISSYPGCMHNGQLDTTCAALANVTFVNVSYQHITTLEGAQYFKWLDSLKCNSDTGLTYIPALSKHLRVLECRNDSLASLPSLPDSLTRLACEFNQITALPALPPALRSLTCYNNQLTGLPALPAGLNTLFCSGNQLDSLPVLPDSLFVLSCYGNRLTRLPALDGLLLDLLCSNNLLASLPNLPTGLVDLSCYSNNLSTLPALPDSLQSLSCSHNHLTALPALPAHITSINCSFNNLASLPSLPDSLFQLFINNNPNLHCLPQLNTIVDFEFNTTGIICLPDFGNIYLTNPDTLFVCDSANNTYGCLQISGVKDITKPVFSIYPNPAKAMIMLTVDENTVGGNVRLIDNNGRLMMSNKITSATARIVTSDLAAGLYLVLVNDAQGRTSVSKLVVE